MDETCARKILKQLKKCGVRFNKLSALSMGISDQAEREAFRKALGTMMVLCDADLIRPIERQHPHLEGIAVKSA